ncbi:MULTISPECIES: sirohydrochlorin chelatase [Roseateles]|uniref:CbiX/SirB N-terminal domain-containing protein n=1 Tax=Roseateles albus TaxID=2987525 RepID=A0ABT5KJ72_9BURK|nr:MULTISPECIES: CbiX/SirB N-terminal domain-containing protein [Roseateles]MCV2361127.1 CbiX/SirB N-terminal domain-containing protein [Paucibacter sp. TC2R-5]MDC8773982.1 CbiX/SirB N-terminal domain-containing protein [Roseateles albus]
MDGLLLFAHGARDPDWARPFHEVSKRIALRRPQLAMRLAFLEFMQPELETAAHELVAMGCRRIHIVPMFLGTGGHVRRDIPPLLERLRETCGPAVEWLLHPALGDQETVVQAMTEASLAWLDGPAGSPDARP